MTVWNKMDTAPTDGRPFLVQYLPYGAPVLCMRKVTMEAAKRGLLVTDCGAWLHVIGIDDDHSYGPTRGEPSWSVAPDKLNNVSAWRWCEIPEAPQSVLDEIKADLARKAA